MDVVSSAPWRFQWYGVREDHRDALLEVLDGLDAGAAVRAEGMLRDRETGRWLATVGGSQDPPGRTAFIEGLAAVWSLDEPACGTVMGNLRSCAPGVAGALLTDLGDGSVPPVELQRRAAALADRDSFEVVRDAAKRPTRSEVARLESVLGTRGPAKDYFQGLDLEQGTAVARMIVGTDPDTTVGEEVARRRAEILATATDARDALTRYATAARNHPDFSAEFVGLSTVVDTPQALAFLAAPVPTTGRRPDNDDWPVVGAVGAHPDPDVRRACARLLADGGPDRALFVTHAAKSRTAAERAGIASAFTCRDTGARGAALGYLDELPEDACGAVLAVWGQAQDAGARERIGQILATESPARGALTELATRYGASSGAGVSAARKLAAVFALDDIRRDHAVGRLNRGRGGDLEEAFRSVECAGWAEARGIARLIGEPDLKRLEDLTDPQRSAADYLTGLGVFGPVAPAGTVTADAQRAAVQQRVRILAHAPQALAGHLVLALEPGPEAVDGLSALLEGPPGALAVLAADSPRTGAQVVRAVGAHPDPDARRECVRLLAADGQDRDRFLAGVAQARAPEEGAGIASAFTCGDTRDDALEYLDNLDEDARGAVLRVWGQAQDSEARKRIGQTLATDTEAREALTDLATDFAGPDDATWNAAARNLAAVFALDDGSRSHALARLGHDLGRRLGALPDADWAAARGVARLLGDPDLKDEDPVFEDLDGLRSLRHGWRLHAHIPAPSPQQEAARQALARTLPVRTPQPETTARFTFPDDKTYTAYKTLAEAVGVPHTWDDEQRTADLKCTLTKYTEKATNPALGRALNQAITTPDQRDRRDLVLKRLKDHGLGGNARRRRAATTLLLLEFFGTPEYKEWLGTQAGAASTDGVAVHSARVVADFHYTPDNTPTEAQRTHLEQQLTAATTPEALIDLATHEPGLLISEHHDHHQARTLLGNPDYLRTLKGRGYDTLYLEGFPSEAQPFINRYLTTGVMPTTLSKALTALDAQFFQGHPLSRDLLHAARDTGMRVIGIDSLKIEQAKVSTMGRGLEMNALAAHLINNDPGRHGKYACIVGAHHTVLRTGAHQKNPGEPGFSPGLRDLIHAPNRPLAVRLYRTKEGRTPNPVPEPGPLHLHARPHLTKPERVQTLPPHPTHPSQGVS